ncbi:MAG: ketopantoate reductase family protein [Candidatus Thermoplasmatota archaeon]|nr:ketopantoate reductase family protein [Candidatus Thermoplasmatota archaeon]
MNIVVLGAGAIGSFFGGLLSKHNQVLLVGRTDHVNKINRQGLLIKGKTQLKRELKAVNSVSQVSSSPDLLILTVKSFDTLHAITQAKKIIGPDTLVLSFQNGLDNLNQIRKIVDKNLILVGIITHGVQFLQPGIIYHKGKGKTIIGEPYQERTQRIQQIADIFNQANISITISSNIIEDIWKKAIVNASINPLTTIFECQNGYLAQNPILTEMVKKICEESVHVAQQNGFSLKAEDLINLTFEVIQQTKKNNSSMLQSIKQGKQTEIDEINGKIAEIGKAKNCTVYLNELLTKIIKSF